MKKTKRIGIYIYDLRTIKSNKKDADRLANVIRSSGKKARVIKSSEGYGVYVK